MIKIWTLGSSPVFTTAGCASTIPSPLPFSTISALLACCTPLLLADLHCLVPAADKTGLTWPFMRQLLATEGLLFSRSHAEVSSQHYKKWASFGQQLPREGLGWMCLVISRSKKMQRTANAVYGLQCKELATATLAEHRVAMAGSLHCGARLGAAGASHQPWPLLVHPPIPNSSHPSLEPYEEMCTCSSRGRRFLPERSQKET